MKLNCCSCGSSYDHKSKQWAMVGSINGSRVMYKCMKCARREMKNRTTEDLLPKDLRFKDTIAKNKVVV